MEGEFTYTRINSPYLHLSDSVTVISKMKQAFALLGLRNQIDNVEIPIFRISNIFLSSFINSGQQHYPHPVEDGFVLPVF